MKQDNNLTRREIEDFHSVLRRAIKWAERRKDFELAERLAREVAAIDFELRAG